MRLALNLGYHAGRGSPAGHLRLAQEAERLGYDSVWVAEAYGSDAPTELAWLAAGTERIGLGSAVMQIPARTPAMTAMTTATVDLLSGGRFRLGLGVSGPQVSEGWHGVAFDDPLARTREYVGLVRAALRRERLTGAGPHYPLPLPDGPGKALRLTLHPLRDRVPLYLGAVGPRNLELTGEIADGWLAAFFAPEDAAPQLARIAAGRARSGADPAAFDIAPTVPVVVGDDVAACARLIRPYAALYLGGMGSRRQNFYQRAAGRMGFGDEAREVQEHYLAGRRQEAAAAVPLELLDRTALIGPPGRIADRLHAYAEAGVTTLVAALFSGAETGVRTLRHLAGALEKAGLR
ncbi:LLM class F420-dependent oxidoreductase [Actinoplanes sp. NPDC051861]|uniref:LLM class F420-dependent oxidoreductase n=1 Tax=Actinoplanes sp. NPDC051861 TaxID=3155170 RepID=UPI00343BF231